MRWSYNKQKGCDLIIPVVTSVAQLVFQALVQQELLLGSAKVCCILAHM